MNAVVGCDVNADAVASSPLCVDALIAATQSTGKVATMASWALGLVFSTHAAALPLAWDRSESSRAPLLECLCSCWNVPAYEDEADWPYRAAHGPGSANFDSAPAFSFLATTCLGALPRSESRSSDFDNVIVDRLLSLIGRLTADGVAALSSGNQVSIDDDALALLGGLLDHLRWCASAAALAPHSRRSAVCRVVANLVYGSTVRQNAVRTLGDLPTVLSCCSYDANSPLMREWAVLAVRNLAAGNEDNQAVIAALEQVDARKRGEARLGKSQS